MHWTEPATADDSHAELEKKLWDAANQLWAGADLKPSEYSPTVLGLIFLRYADVRFAAVEQELGRANRPGEPTSRRRRIGPADYHAAGVVYLPDDARFSPTFQEHPPKQWKSLLVEYPIDPRRSRDLQERQ